MALNVDPLLIMAQKAIQTTAQETAAEQNRRQQQQQLQQQATTSIAQKATQTTAQQTAAQQKQRQAAADRFKLAAQGGFKRGILASRMSPQMPAQPKLLKEKE